MADDRDVAGAVVEVVVGHHNHRDLAGLEAALAELGRGVFAGREGGLAEAADQAAEVLAAVGGDRGVPADFPNNSDVLDRSSEISYGFGYIQNREDQMPLPGADERPIMSKKMAISFLAAVSAVLLAYPASPAAQEIHLEGVTSFTGSGGEASIVASGEPTTTCQSAHITLGRVDVGGTTGSMDIDWTGCHSTVLGFTVKCHTSGSPVDNTISSGGTTHTITVNTKAGIAVTLNTTEVICAGISNTHIEGNALLGTITGPACGSESKTFNISFAATGSTQNDLSYTGVNYDLKAKTSGGSQLTAGLNGGITLTAGTSGKLNCT